MVSTKQEQKKKKKKKIVHAVPLIRKISAKGPEKGMLAVTMCDGSQTKHKKQEGLEPNHNLLKIFPSDKKFIESRKLGVYECLWLSFMGQLQHLFANHKLSEQLLADAALTEVLTVASLDRIVKELQERLSVSEVDPRKHGSVQEGYRTGMYVPLHDVL